MLFSSWQYLLVMLYYRISRPLRKMLSPEVSVLRKTIEFFSPFNQPPDSSEQRFEEIEGVNTLISNWKDTSPDAVFLFLHGGGFSLCSPKTHANLMAHLSKYCNATVFGPEYGLAPEHKFPTALAQCEVVYKYLVEKYPERKFYIGGDSAGGNLSAALCILIDQKNLRKPDGLVLLSPWLDLSETSKSMLENRKRDSIFDTEDLEDYALRYCEKEERDNPLVSPLLADVDAFPPVLIQATKNEFLFPDSESFADKLKANGKVVVEQFYDKLFHGWQVFPSFMPEAKDALKKIGDFVTGQSKH